MNRKTNNCLSHQIIKHTKSHHIRWWKSRSSGTCT